MDLHRRLSGHRTQARVALSAALLLSVLHPGRLNGSAWTQTRGHGQIILTSSLFRTATAFDQDSNDQRFGNAGRFRQFNLNPYFEYGLTSRNTLVVNAFIPFLAFRNQDSKQTSAGLGDMEVGLKHRFNAPESPWAFSGQMTVMFPTYPDTRTPAPGNHQQDIEGRILAGRGGTIAGHHAFFNTECAYRYRFGAPADHVRSDLTIGFDLAPRLSLMGQFFAIKGLRNGDPFHANSNPNAQSDFDLYKYQPSLLLNLGRGTRIQVGWNDAFVGRNTGRGHAAILALWKTF